MKKKINAKFMLISAISIVVTAVCAMMLFYNILKDQIFDDLKANAHVISKMQVNLLPTELDDTIMRDGLRITLIRPDGSVMYDSLEDETQMENHKSRPEIMQALQNGEGEAMRKSVTSSRHTFYYAMKTDDGTILRIGKDSNSIYNFMFTMTVTIVLVGLIVFALCAFYAHKLTSRLVLPIEKMADNLVLVDEDSVYEEMRPFVSTIKKQHVDILNHAKMRQEFTANVSHELKTPLTAISGYAELIANGMTNGDDTVHFANEIHRSAERLQSLINDIIKLSELDDSSLKLEYETLDLYPMAENCLESLKMQAEKNDIQLQLKGESTSIRGDKSLIEELIYNLCSNAIRYNKKGGNVTVTTDYVNGRAVLKVKDTGIGIPEDQQERVFERFYRVDKSRSKSTGGTGLGLAIVKHIVVQHEAQITLKSKEGEGTEITVTF